jgi:hypothetical protein
LKISSCIRNVLYQNRSPRAGKRENWQFVWSVTLAKSNVPRKTWRKLWHSSISKLFLTKMQVKFSIFLKISSCIRNVLYQNRSPRAGKRENWQFVDLSRLQFTSDYLYHCQGNEQKQVAIYSSIPNLKSPSIRTPSLLKNNLFQFQNIYILSNGFPHLFGATFSGYKMYSALPILRIWPQFNWHPVFNLFMIN